MVEYYIQCSIKVEAPVNLSSTILSLKPDKKGVAL